MADLALLAVLLWNGYPAVPALSAGLILILPCGLGSLVGAMSFPPDAERLCRDIACRVIAASAIMGLPVRD